MEHKLKIHIKKQIYGIITPLYIKIGNNDEYKFSKGQTRTYIVDESPIPIHIRMFGNAIQFHKIISESVIFPSFQKSAEIECEVSITPNWIGGLSLGLLQPVSKIKVEIKY